jgi:hypothetical protein
MTEDSGWGVNLAAITPVPTLLVCGGAGTIHAASQAVPILAATPTKNHAIPRRMTWLGS